MRIKDYDDKDGKRVWLSERELQLLIKNVDENHCRIWSVIPA